MTFLYNIRCRIGKMASENICIYNREKRGGGKRGGREKILVQWRALDNKGDFLCNFAFRHLAHPVAIEVKLLNLKHV